ncbi:Phage replication protein O [Sodalis praecaptivus]|uniref:Phage replication protein O n=1 Tax=Sodalis praecaptivus TaxID=1239307 RepID=W0HVS4_9GAMM|nr:replication protein [Sodalis praecaptivus]AHF77931.1 Phage replication protein O [Sodalis praecaptivus]
MGSLAENIVIPIRPDLRAVERRVVDTDDGYTRIANELLEAVMLSGLTQNQLLIALAVIRKTYGYNRKSDWISNSQLSELTGIPETRCSTTRNELIKLNVIRAEGRQTGVNKEISGWLTKINGICKPLRNPSTFTQSVKKSFTESVIDPLRNPLNTKDKHTKDNKDNINPPIIPQAINSEAEKKQPSSKFDPMQVTLPEWLSRQTWQSWVCYRKDIKKAIKSQQTVTQAINVLDRSRSKGATPEDVINQSIANGWTGLFEPKQAAKPVQHRTMTENFNAKDYGSTQMPSWARE